MSRRRLTLAVIARGVLRRTLWISRYLLWRALAGDAVADLPAPDGLTLTRVDSAAGDAGRVMADRAMRAADEPEGLVAPRLQDGHVFFAWTVDDRAASFAWVRFADRSIGPIRLANAPGRAFFYNGFTSGEYRGRGLFQALLLQMRRALAQEGWVECITDIDTRNTASARGAERAGFRPVAQLTFLTVFGTWRLALRRQLLTDVRPALFP